VFRHAHPEAELEREGLSANAAHPLLRAVTLERSRHRAPPPDTLRALMAQVPDDFRFVAYASLRSTCASFRRGEANTDFLDPIVGRALLLPLVESLGERLGVVIVELPRVDPAAYGGRKTIPERLHRFLRALPPGPCYAVDPHDHKWIGPAYADALASAGAVHCLGVHPHAPTLTRQRAITGALVGDCVIRWSLGPRFDYDSTRRYLEPFDALSRPDPTTRAAVCEAVAAARADERAAWVLVGNEAEGCAPRSIAALAGDLAGA
jgi:uncharacterized protein YecE (DUF72 family)